MHLKEQLGQRGTHHGTLGKGTDFLDGTRSTLFESNTVALYRKEVVVSLPPKCQLGEINSARCCCLLLRPWRWSGLHQINSSLFPDIKSQHFFHLQMERAEDEILLRFPTGRLAGGNNTDFCFHRLLPECCSRSNVPPQNCSRFESSQVGRSGAVNVLSCAG